MNSNLKLKPPNHTESDSRGGERVNRGASTYIASSKFFSAMALLPRAFSSSAMVEYEFQKLARRIWVSYVQKWRVLHKSRIQIDSPGCISRAFHLNSAKLPVHRLNHVSGCLISGAWARTAPIKRRSYKNPLHFTLTPPDLFGLEKRP